MTPIGARAHGFTVVELVTVIIVLGILSIGTVKFIADSSSGYASTVSRAQLATDARFVINRLARELRDALPNSIRVSGSCIEHVPVVSASTYITLPVAISATSFRSVPVDPIAPAGARVAVYPNTGLYALGVPGIVSPAAVVSAPDASNEVTITLAAAHRFVAESPSNRYFFVLDPVSHCLDAGRLWRYQGYGFLAAQPVAADLPAAAPGRALLAESVAATVPFAYSAPTLTRNAVVEIALDFTSGADAVTIEHLAQVRNVP